MRKAVLKGLTVFQFHLIQSFSDDIQHGVTTRREPVGADAPSAQRGASGNSPFGRGEFNLKFMEDGEDSAKVRKNRVKLLESFGVKVGVSAQQTHSKNVLLVDEKVVHDQAFTLSRPQREAQDFDGFVTNLREVGLLVQVADCQAILFFDSKNKALGLAHAGWRGLGKNISAEVVKMMRENFGTEPRDLLVGISPSLGPQNAEFSDPLHELPESFAPYILDGRRVDLWEYSRDQLLRLGVPASSIEEARICTMSPAGAKFYSYRKEGGKSGRFGLFAYLK